MSTSTAPSTTQPTSSANPSTDPQDSTPTSQQQPLPLPAPAPESTSTKLNVDGDSVKLDHLGPMVVNKDGTLSRISNWEKMSEIERRNTLRVLGKRNKSRLEGLREGMGQEGEGGEGGKV